MTRPRHQIPGQIVLPIDMFDSLRELANFACDTAGTSGIAAVEAELKAVDEHVEKQTFPRYAVWPGIGRVRVVEYLGNDYFRVLDKGDHRRRVHRDTLQFLPGRSRKR